MKWLLSRILYCFLVLWLLVGAFFALCAVAPHGQAVFSGGFLTGELEMLQFQFQIRKVPIAPYQILNQLPGRTRDG